MTEAIYHIPVWETIKKAWHKLKGAKASFWAALIILYLVMIGFRILEKALEGQEGVLFFVSLIGQILSLLLQVGVIYMGIQRALDLEINYKLIFHAFDGELALKAIILYLFQTLILLPFIIIAIGAVFYELFHMFPEGGTEITKEMFYAALNQPMVIITLIITGLIMLYIIVRMSLSVAYVVDQRSKPTQAIALSFKATRSNFFRVLGISICTLILIIISAIPFGIGLIWTLPLAYIIYGVIYQSLRINSENS